MRTSTSASCTSSHALGAGTYGSRTGSTHGGGRRRPERGGCSTTGTTGACLRRRQGPRGSAEVPDDLLVREGVHDILLREPAAPRGSHAEPHEPQLLPR